jgi:hypothetical protein
MRLRVLTSIAVVAGLSVLFIGAQPAFAAAPRISVSIVNGNAGTLKVTGSNFVKNSVALVEFNQNGPNSGDFTQQFNVAVNGSGRFTLTQQAYITAACLVGVSAWGDSGASNDVSVNTKGKGCTGAQLATKPCSPNCISVSGKGFTPGATSIDLNVDITDAAGQTTTNTIPMHACGGPIVPGPYPPSPAGALVLPGFSACTGVLSRNAGYCHAASISVYAYEQETDFETPRVSAPVPSCV